MTGIIVNTPEYPTELRLFRVGNDSTAREDADLIVPAADLTNRDENAIDVTRRIQEWKDKATVGVKGQGTDGTDYRGEITSGDRIEYWASWVSPDERHLDPRPVYSDRRWTGYAFQPKRSASGPRSITLSFDATDFVFEVLSSRNVSDAFTDTLIAGTEDAIINRLVAEHAPVIDRSQIEDVGVSTSREFDARGLKEICADLSETADALMASEGTSLIYRPFEDIPVKHELGWSDVQGDVEVDPDDTEIVNDWRVDGGTGSAPDETQETVDDYVLVTEDLPIEYELSPEKNRLDRADVFTRKASEDDLRVRVQAPNADGTGPRDAGDTSKDIISDSSEPEFVSQDDWRHRFKFKHEPLPDNPWLIIDTNGSDGHEIGVDADGAPAFRTYYPYDVMIRVDDPESIANDRLRQDRIKKDILTTFDAARDVGEAKLRHSVQAPETVGCRAKTARAHQLSPGEVVDCGFDAVGATGPHLVIERSESYDGSSNQLTTDLTLQSVVSL